MADKLNSELENEIVEGSETPDVDAEKKSVDSVEKAADAGKTATARKGDKKNSEKTELSNKAQDVGTDMGKATVKKANEGSTYSEELSNLVESEATLSEEFKEKTAIIFEAALKNKLSEEIDRMEESYANELAEEVSSYKASMTDKIDSYLSYVVETWMAENKLAVTNGLRAEIAENFMTKLKDVFTESYITVPESKEDLVDGLVEQVGFLELELNKATKDNIEMVEEIQAYKKEMIIRESARGLADTQVEKLHSLVEDIEFTSAEAFTSKVKTIRESFFAVKAPVVESVEEDYSDVKEVSSIMEAYVKALKK